MHYCYQINIYIYTAVMFAVSWLFISQECLSPVAYQGVAAVTSILIPSLVIRLVVLTQLSEWHINLLGTLSGAAVLIHYYEGSSVYFFILCIICYFLLTTVEYKGVTVAVLSVAFIIAL